MTSSRDANGVMRAVYDPAMQALRISGVGNEGAPVNASYVTTVAESGLDSEVVLGTGIVMRGTGAAKPAASVAGRLYTETDGSLITYRDSGAAWFEIGRGEAGIRLAQLAEKAYSSLTFSGLTAGHYWRASSATAAGFAAIAYADLPVGTAASTIAAGDDSRFAASVTYVNHGATAGTARPSGFAAVVWVGSVTPSNAIDGDLWVDTT